MSKSASISDNGFGADDRRSRSLSDSTSISSFWKILKVLGMISAIVLFFNYDRIGRWWQHEQDKRAYIDSLTLENGDYSLRDITAYFKNGQFHLLILLDNDLPANGMRGVDDRKFEADWSVAVVMDDKEVHAENWSGSPKVRILWGSIDAPRHASVQHYVDRGAEIRIRISQNGKQVFAVDEKLKEKKPDDLDLIAEGMAHLLFFNNRSDEFLGEGKRRASEGQTREAIAAFTNAIKECPYNAKAFLERGRVYSKIGELDFARPDFLEAVRLSEADSSPSTNLAYVMNRSSDFNITQLQSLPESILNKFYDNAAYYFATHQQASHRNASMSLTWAKLACESASNKNPQYLATLACAYAEAGDFALSIDAAEQAKSLLSGQESQMASRLDRMLAAFKSKEPFRQSNGFWPDAL